MKPINRTSVVIVFYDRLAELVQCLDSLRSETCEVIVVDVSPESSARGLVESLRSAHYVCAPENRGYGWACNLGIEHSASMNIVICNSDAIFGAGSVDELVGVASSGRCMVAPVQYGHGFRAPRIDSLLPLPGMRATLSRWVWLGRRIQLTRRNADLEEIVQSGRAHDVGGKYALSGACICMSRGVYDELGGFDEDFFLYEEDIDLSVRAHSRGIRILLDGGASIIHESGTNDRGVNARTLRTGLRSEAILWEKHELGRAGQLRTIQRVGLGVRTVGSLARGQWATAKSYLHVFMRPNR